MAGNNGTQHSCHNGKTFMSILGIFHGLIVNTLVPGPSEGKHCQDEGVMCPMTVTDE